MKTRLIAYCSENIGQMPDYMAWAEVERMRRQTGNPNWHMDYSDELYCPDETSGVHNPCPRTKTWTNPLNRVTYVHCWVTCSFDVQQIEEEEENKIKA